MQLADPRDASDLPDELIEGYMAFKAKKVRLGGREPISGDALILLCMRFAPEEYEAADRITEADRIIAGWLDRSLGYDTPVEIFWRKRWVSGRLRSVSSQRRDALVYIDEAEDERTKELDKIRLMRTDVAMTEEELAGA